ncbi:Helix-turn-helix domain-containing protein [Chitinophaga jiangningensis]|uniref:Helix-turn-helix domain-containing protein n=2 Tax=Chitinophaga jiangningensis TaxID=1419482 RepID=A0A1M7MB41_9BACT|nr:Helix-turn-helix domain-containing protein [Chitinophaga jiangningensis]
MEKKPLSLEEFYAGMPYIGAAVNKPVGHFNILEMKKFLPEESDIIPYGRKDFYKVCLFTGKSAIHYADKTFKINGHALFFAGPMIPYNWELETTTPSGYSCIFNEMYFENYGRLTSYPVFLPGANPVFELSPEQYQQSAAIFEQIIAEKAGHFEFKDDVIRNSLFQVIHAALKLKPAEIVLPQKANAASRITNLFLDLLEKQFPISTHDADTPLRAPSDYAARLAIHVNHLNKSVKEVMQKTTSEIIMERLLKEARILLKHSSWSISEIAFSLGFEGPTHFGSFFKKQLQISPSQFRNQF